MALKTLGDSYLYGKFNNDKDLMNLIMSGDRVDKEDKAAFEDIKYEVTRCPISNVLVKVLMNPNVVLVMGPKALAKAFKVVTMKDIKKDRKEKVFIDCTDLITYDGKYHCKNINMLISYLVSAMIHMIYTFRPNLIMNNSNIVTRSAETWTILFTYIIDYIYKISVADTNVKEKCNHLAALYFYANILKRDINSEQVRSACRKISKLSEREEDLLRIKMKEDTFLNIKTFIEFVSQILGFDKLTLDIVVEKWMWLYGTGTVFGLELYTSFTTMITDAYVGSFINNQKTIEKVAGSHMVELTKALIKLGESA